MNVKMITIERKAMYDNVTSLLYDMLTSDDTPVSATMIMDLMGGFGSVPHLKKAFEDGNTFILIGEKMEEIERLEAAKKPYVIVVVDGNKLIAAIPSTELTY
jgi:hypothetical protein